MLQFLFIVVGFGEASDAILILRAASQCSALVWILLVLLQGHNYSVSSFSSRSRMILGPGGILRLSMTLLGWLPWLNVIRLFGRADQGLATSLFYKSLDRLLSAPFRASPFHTCQPSVIGTESPSFWHRWKPPSRRRKSPSFDGHFEI